MDPLGFVLVLGVAVLALSVMAALCVVQRHAVRVVRAERDVLRVRLATVIADRDGWREVATRALLVAQIGRRVTERAARVAARKASTES